MLRTRWLTRLLFLAALPVLVALGPATASAAVGWNPGGVVSAGGKVGSPDAAIAPDGGEAVVVWDLDEGSSSTIQAVRRVAGGTWSEPVDLSPPGRRAEDPQVAIDDEGETFVVWGLEHGPVQESTHGSGGWSEPAFLSTPGAEAREPQIATDATGVVVAVWVRWNGSVDRIQATSLGGEGKWRSPRSISPPAPLLLSPRIAVDRADGAVAAWERRDGGSARIEAAKRLVARHQVWRAAAVVSPAGETCVAPSVGAGEREEQRRRGEADEEGVVAFRCDRAGGSVVVATLWRDLNRVWQLPQQISRGGEDVVSTPEVAMNAAGESVAIWSAGGRLSFARKPALRLDPAQPWQAPEAVATGPSPGDPRLGTDDDGDLVAVWDGPGTAAPYVGGASDLNWEGSSTAAQTADLAGEGDPAGEAEVAVDAHGDGVAVWRGGGVGGTTIEVAEYAKATTPDEVLAGLPLRDSFARKSEDPLSLKGSWRRLDWAYSAGRVANGWTRSEAVHRVNGAYWVPDEFVDTTFGDAVRAVTGCGSKVHAVSLWLNMPKPGRRKAGYQLHLSGQLGSCEIEIIDWEGRASHTVIASGVFRLRSGVAALVAKGNLLSAWTTTRRGSFREILLGALGSAPRHDAGRVGLAGTDPGLRVGNFSAGTLPSAEHEVWPYPRSRSASTDFGPN